jgi:signal transduction histidine kinase/CheY-like chemotaxis protein
MAGSECVTAVTISKPVVLDLDYNVTQAGTITSAPDTATSTTPSSRCTSSVHNHTGGRRRSVSITEALSTPRGRIDIYNPCGTHPATPPTIDPGVHDSKTLETSCSKRHPALETEHRDQNHPRAPSCFNSVKSCCDILFESDGDDGESESNGIDDTMSKGSEKRHCYSGCSAVVVEGTIMIMCAIVVTMVGLSSTSSREKWLSASLVTKSAALYSSLLGVLHTDHAAAIFMRNVFVQEPQTTRAQFHVLTQDLTYDSLLALEWTPRVLPNQISNIESVASAEVGKSIFIRERYNSTTMTPVAHRAEYFPVLYAEPLAPNLGAVLFDLYSSPSRAAAIDKARMSGEPVTTEPISLVQRTSRNIGFLSFYPVYSLPSNLTVTNATEAQRIQHMIGVTLGVFSVADLLDAAIGSTDLQSTEITICDVTDGANPTILVSAHVDAANKAYDSVGIRSTATSDVARTQCTPGNSSHVNSRETLVHNRMWQLNVVRASGFDNAHSASDGLGMLLYLSIAAGFAVTLYVIFNSVRLRHSIRKNRRLLQAAKSANSAKRTFVAFLCHELRNPLHAISSAVDELICEYSIAKDIINSLSIGAQTMLSIVNDILDMSKIEAGAFELSCEKMNMTDVMQAALATFEPWATENQLKLEMKTDPGVPEWIVGDPTRVTQVLNNLLSNAVKFSPENGSITLRAHLQTVDCKNACSPHIDDISATQGTKRTVLDSKRTHVSMTSMNNIEAKTNSECDQYVVLSIADTGAGMTSEELETIFRPFAQLASQRPSSSGKNKKKKKGTGIGLTIVCTIVEAMGGFIQVQSEVGEGTTFSIFLPLVLSNELQNGDCQTAPAAAVEVSDYKVHVVAVTPQCHETVIELASTSTSSTRSEQPVVDMSEHEPLALLSVDDEKMNRKIMGRMMKRAFPHIQMIEAANGAEAIDIVMQNLQDRKLDKLGTPRIVCICMDINMPVMDGMEACCELGRLGIDIPICAVTANAFASDRENCINAGMTDILAKPFKLQQFKDIIRKYLTLV